MTVFLAAGFALASDQLLKLYVIMVAELGVADRLEIAPPYLVLRMLWNHGINFGFLSGFDLRWPLFAIALAVAVVMLIWGVRQASTWLRLAAGLIAGGAVGNAIDRAYWGAVADVLNMSCCGIDNPYVFNLADMWVFVGVGALLIASWGKRGS